MGTWKSTWSPPVPVPHSHGPRLGRMILYALFTRDGFGLDYMMFIRIVGYLSIYTATDVHFFGKVRARERETRRRQLQPSSQRSSRLIDAATASPRQPANCSTVRATGHRSESGSYYPAITRPALTPAPCPAHAPPPPPPHLPAHGPLRRRAWLQMRV